MTAAEAIEVIESTPIMRMERTSDTPLSELGEALTLAIGALRECAGCPCFGTGGTCLKDDMK